MANAIPATEFERLVREHHAAVYRTARRVLRDESLALDAAQQTFVRALEGKLRFDGGDRGRVLRCVAAREALMLLRSSKSRARREAETAMQRPERIHDPEPEQREAIAALRRAVSGLPDDLRVAVALRFQEDLTYADVAEATGISEPSAHERVQRALDKLRGAMSSRGFAGLAAVLPEMLAREESIPVPPILEARLLALPHATAAASAGIGASVWIAAAALAVGAVWVGLRALGDGDTDDSAVAAVPDALALSPRPMESGSIDVERRSVTNGGAFDARDAEESPVSEVDSDPRWSGVIEGRVVDLAGSPLEGASVRATSVERDGKFATFSGETSSDRFGSFRLELPVAVAAGQIYVLEARIPSASLRVDSVAVPADGAAEFQTLVLGAAANDRPGDWELEVEVLTRDGIPLADAWVHVFRPETHTDGSVGLAQDWQATTGPDGVARAHGKRLGTKVLAVSARGGQGYAEKRVVVEIEAATSARRTVQLEPGLSIEGTIVDDAGVPIDPARAGARWLQLYAVAGGENEWHTAEWTAPGRFTIASLDDRPYRLRCSSERWSAFELADVVPGRGELSLALKLRHDPRDVGDHLAEIHVEVFDAATRAPIALDVLDVRAVRIRNESPALEDGDYAPIWLVPYVAQVAASGDEGELPAPPPHLFVDDGLVAGRYLVCAYIDGYAPEGLGPIEVGEREIASGLAVYLDRGAKVEGVVFDVESKPVAGALVALAGRGELSRRYVASLDENLRATAGRGNQPYATVRTDAEGRFVLKNVPCGVALDLVAVHPEREPCVAPAPMLAEGATARGVELRMPLARKR